MSKPTVSHRSILGFTILLCGCGTLYKLDVTAYSDPNSELDNTYVILSANPAIELESPEFTRYAKQLERALEAKNYKRVSGDELDGAALAVYMYVGISEPGKRYHEVSQGVRETDYDTTSTREAQPGPSSGGSNGGQGGQAGSQVRSVEPPRSNVLVGYESQKFATTVYKKYLSVQAIDLHQYAEDLEKLGAERAVPQEIWSIDVETTGQPADLSEVVPVMIAAAKPYIATSTDTTRVTLNAGDSEIRSIKGH